MWLLLAVALAADPPPAGVPATAAPAATSTMGAATPAAGAPSAVGPRTAAEAGPRVAPAVRRACDHGQLCDGRCIPWTEPCAAAVRESVAVLIEADRVEARNAALCEPAPGLPAPPPTDPGLAMLRDSVLVTLCEADADERDPDCARKIREQALATPARSVCGDPPVIAPGPESAGR